MITEAFTMHEGGNTEDEIMHYVCMRLFIVLQSEAQPEKIRYNKGLRMIHNS